MRLVKLFLILTVISGIFSVRSNCLGKTKIGGSHPVTELFSLGVEAYNKNNFKKSVYCFEEILSNGLESGAIYYNLGNAYFRMNKLAKARLAYERAKRFMPGNSDLLANIAFLKTRLEDKVSLPSPHWFWRVYYFPGELLNRNKLSFFVLMSFLFVMGLWFIAVLTARFRLTTKIFFTVGVSIFIWLGSVLFVKVYLESTPRYGVIIPDEAAVRWGNTKSDKVAFYLHEGTKVIIRQQRGNWVLITIGKDKTGWIMKDQIGVI